MTAPLTAVDPDRPRPRPYSSPPAAHRSETGPHRAEPPVRRTRRPRPSRDWFWKTWHWRLFLVLSTVGTFGLHVFRDNKTVDLFIDESFYTQVGQSIARGGMPNATGSNFFLHPPGFFVLEAGWIKLFGAHSEVFAQVFSLRKLVAVIAALTALMLALVVEKAVGRTAAAIVTVFYAMNAFSNQESSIVILEPSTLFWTLAGYAVFMRLGPVGSVRRRRQIILAGLLFGYAALSKEFAVFVTVLPLLIALVMKCWLTRREAATAITMTAVPWAIWLVIVELTGNWHEFSVQVTAGFRRTAGTTQISGFNQQGSPSFLDAIINNLYFLWTAYLILGFGSLAIIYLAVTAKADQRLRFLSLFGVGAIPLLAYCVLIGTNEEQFFNFLFFPALICLVAVLWENWRRLRTAVKALTVLLVAAALISDYTEYVVVHTEPDNGTYQVDKWMVEHVPNGTVVSVTNPVQREVFLRYTMVDDAPNTVLKPDVRYLVVFYTQVDEGYAFVDRATINRQIRGQRAVFSTHDRSNGRMVVYAIK